MHKNVYTKKLHYAGVFWYLSSPYWIWLYLSLSGIDNRFDTKVVYGNKNQYRFDMHGLFKDASIRLAII